jgi:flagellar motor switch protein FliG
MADEKGDEKTKRAPFGGVQGIVDMLKVMDGPERDKLLANLRARDPKLAGELDRRLFTFEDLAGAGPEVVDELVRQVPAGKLALALRGASEALRATIFGRMSARAAKNLADEIDALGPRRVSDVEAARQEILRLLHLKS